MFISKRVSVTYLGRVLHLRMLQWVLAIRCFIYERKASPAIERYETRSENRALLVIDPPLGPVS